MPEHRTNEELDELLRSLSNRTAGVTASPAFSDRMMSALSATPMVGRWSAIIGASRTALALATIAAVIATAWAIETEQESDEAMAAAYGAPVKEW